MLGLSAYTWWKFLHVVGVIAFVTFHGVSVMAALRGGRQACAGPHEVVVHPLEQARLLGREAQFGPPAMQRIDAREQPGVHVDRIAVRGQRPGQLALHLLQRR